MKVRYFIILLVGLLISCNLVQASADFYFTNLRIAANTRTAVIIWSVNQPATGIISFGLTNSYGSWIQDTRFQSYHETELDGLKPNLTYHFSIQSRNSDGQVVNSDDYQFTTKNGNDGVPPEISNIKVTSITANTITVAWTTDEDSDSTIFFDTVDKTNLGGRRSDGRKVTQHDLTATGLKGGTRYFFQVGSKDASGAERRSGSYSAITNPGTDQKASDLQITYLTPFNRELSQSSDLVTFHLMTNRVTGGRIRYGERSKSYPSTLELPAPRDSDTAFTITSLKPDTVYYYILDLVDVLGKKLLSPEYTFRTPPINILRGPGTVVQPAIIQPAGSGSYSYGQDRVGDLKIEQTKATELYWALVARLGSRRINRISKINWQTLIKSYIYGGYPVAAIAQAIKWGGFTVHPAIPWSIWQNSQQYKNYINR